MPSVVDGHERPAMTLPRLDVLIKFDKVRRDMPRPQSPSGTPVTEARSRRARRSPSYRREQARLAPYEGIARLVIKHRMALELSQAELAERMGTSHSAISRIESGQHKTSVATLQRLAEALDLRFVVGFESGPRGRPVRELVAV